MHSADTRALIKAHTLEMRHKHKYKHSAVKGLIMGKASFVMLLCALRMTFIHE